VLRKRARRGRQGGGRTGQIGPGTSAGAEPDTGYSQALAFAQCMPTQDVPNFPDRTSNGIVSRGNLKVSQSQLEAAENDCQYLLPTGAQPRRRPSSRRPTSSSSPGTCALTGCRTGATPPTRAASWSSTGGPCRRRLRLRSSNASRSCTCPSRSCTYPRVSPRPGEVQGSEVGRERDGSRGPSPRRAPRDGAPRQHVVQRGSTMSSPMLGTRQTSRVANSVRPHGGWAYRRAALRLLGIQGEPERTAVVVLGSRSGSYACFSAHRLHGWTNS
jgi:hypothetical protein